MGGGFRHHAVRAVPVGEIDLAVIENAECSGISAESGFESVPLLGAADRHGACCHKFKRIVVATGAVLAVEI